MNEMRYGYADTELGQIHYREEGEGEPVLLLHQTASGSVMYNRNLPLLAAAGYRAIAMDTPGFGMSVRPTDMPSVAYYARSVSHFLQAMDIERAHVVGVRTGASIALEVAATYPEQVQRLVVCSLLAVRNEEHRLAIEGTAQKHAWAPDTNGDFLTEKVRGWVHHFAVPGDDQQYLDELIWALQAGPQYWWAYRAVVGHDAYSCLERITAPTLFLNPERDDQYEMMCEAHAAMPASQYREMSGLDPQGQGRASITASRPEEWTRRVVDFLRTQD